MSHHWRRKEMSEPSYVRFWALVLISLVTIGVGVGFWALWAFVWVLSSIAPPGFG